MREKLYTAVPVGTVSYALPKVEPGDPAGTAAPVSVARKPPSPPVLGAAIRMRSGASRQSAHDDAVGQP